MKRCRIISVLLMAIMITCLCGTTVSAKTKTKIAISDKKISIEVGETYQLSVTGTNKSVTWSSADDTIASVSKTGIVTGVSIGKVKVTAKCNGKKYSCQVSVKASTTTSLSMLNDVYARNFTAWLEKNYTIKDVDENDDTIEIKMDTDMYEKAINTTLERIESGIPQLQERDDSVMVEVNDNTMLSYTVYCDFKITDSEGNTVDSIYTDSEARDKFFSFVAEDIFHYAYLTGHTIDDVTILFTNNNTSMNLTDEFPETDTYYGDIKNITWLIDKDL